MTVLLVAGTGTGVGKTTTVAVIAACAGGSVVAVKPAQTGAAAGAPGDLAAVTRLVPRVRTGEFARYPDRLAPHHASWVGRVPALRFADTVRRIDDLDATLAVTRLEDEQVALAGIVSVDRPPAQPELVARCAVGDLQGLAPGHRLAGVLPDGLPAAGRFVPNARAAVTSEWGGCLDSRTFVAAQVP